MLRPRVLVQHVEEAWAQAQPVAAALLAAFPQHLRPEQLDRGSFMYAVQLWYAYSMQVCTCRTQHAVAVSATHRIAQSTCSIAWKHWFN